MLFPVLDTDRLRLVEIEQRFCEDYYEIRSRNDVTQYYGSESLSSLNQASKIIDSFKQNFIIKRGIRWGIIVKDTEKFIGTIGLNLLNIPGKRAEVGYEIHPDYWRKGYTLEALRRILRYSYMDLDLYRIGAVTFPDNIASSGLLKKIGFVEEGILRGYIFQHGKSNDAQIFSLLKSEYV